MELEKFFPAAPCGLAVLLAGSARSWPIGSAGVTGTTPLVFLLLVAVAKPQHRGELRSKRGSPLYKNINIRTHTTLARLSGGNLWNGGNAGRFYANLNNWLDGGNWNYAARISVMIIVVCFVVLKTTRKAWAECPKFLKPASSRQQCREDPATEVGAGRG